MFVPIILRSNKTVISVAMGHNEFWPLYMSIGNVHNGARRAHGNAVVLIAFLCVPNSKYNSLASVNLLLIWLNSGQGTCWRQAIQNFRRQMFHQSLFMILSSLKQGMEEPEVLWCPDGHFQCIIYGLGPYIADYPEQVLLTCVIQNWCPKCEAFSF